MFLKAGDRITEVDYFSPIVLEGDRSFISEAEAFERSAKIEGHEFFIRATVDRTALELWVTQEAVVTNPFSQILLATMAQIRNVHVRALLMPVIAGEHGPVVSGTATKAHPWLIWRLCKSLGIGSAPLVPTAAVLTFLAALEGSITNPMRALGVLGIGNELMLLAEYRTIERCFDLLCPDAEYEGFLHGNIDEDEMHTRLIENAAVALRNLGYDSRDFVEGAKAGVTARVAYYDALLGEIG